MHKALAIAFLAVAIPTQVTAQGATWDAVLNPFGLLASQPPLPTYGSAPCGNRITLPDTVLLAGPAGVGVRFYGFISGAGPGGFDRVETRAPLARDSLPFTVRSARCRDENGPPHSILLESRGRYLMFQAPEGTPTYADILAKGADGRWRSLYWSDEVREFNTDDRLTAAEMAARTPARGESIAELEESVRVAMVRARGYPTAVLRKILARELEIGWTQQMVRDSWGRPADIHTTVTSAGSTEQWVYVVGSRRFYIYFRNGRVAALQS